jgi:hypothetical protein
VLPAAPVGRTAALAGACLAGTFALSIASVGWASDQGRAFDEAARVSFYLGLFALAACSASGRARSEWIAGLTLGLAAVTTVAVFAYLQPGLIDTGSNEIPNAAGRLSYPLGYWNAAAALMAVGAVLLAWASVSDGSRALRAVATAAIPVVGLGIWLASSRGGAIAVVLGWGVLLAATSDRGRLAVKMALGALGAAVLIGVGDRMSALTNGLADAAQRSDGDRMTALLVGVVIATAGAAWWADRFRPSLRLSRRAWAGIGVAAAVVVAVAVAAANPADKVRDFTHAPDTRAGMPLGEAGVSSNGRWQFWSEAVDAFESAPAGGIGAGGYEEYWAQHAPVALFVRNPHSLPLQQAAELGIGGILLFAGFLAALIVAARRGLARGRHGDAGVLLAVIVAGALGATIDWTWELPAAFAPVIVAAGLLTASAPDGEREWDRYWVGAGTVGLAWLAMIVGGLVVLTELELKQSRTDASAARIEDGIQSAEHARTVQPWSAEPYTQLALLDEQRGDVDGALGYLQQAEDRDSEDWRLPLIEARLQSRRGDERAARVALDRARSLSPLLPIFTSNETNQG